MLRADRRPCAALCSMGSEHGGDRGRSAAGRRVGARSYQVYVRGRLKFRVKQIVYVARS